MPLTMTAEREAETYYAVYCCGACQHCASGNKQIDHATYGLRHIVIAGDSWDESTHVSCTALPLADWAQITIRAARAAHQETQAKLDELREALKYKQRGMTFVESERNIELVRQKLLAEQQLAETQAIARELHHALSSLFALVNGECPSLLEDDHHYVLVTEALEGYAKAKGVLPAAPEGGSTKEKETV